MRYALAGLMILTAALNAAAQSPGSMGIAKNLEISGSGIRVQEDCKGRSVSITGSDLLVNLLGTCAAVEVAGNNNRVSATIAAGASLAVYGFGNDIQWSSAGKVTVEVAGPDNRVGQGAN